VTPILTALASGIVTEVLLIVAALAALVGIGVLVAYGFRHLRYVSGEGFMDQETRDRYEDDYGI
jgi:hypothetical protein